MKLYSKLITSDSVVIRMLSLQFFYSLMDIFLGSSKIYTKIKFDNIIKWKDLIKFYLLSTHNYCESINYSIPFLITSIYAITIPFKQKFYMPK
jgi:hypothetical protein